MHTYVEVFGVVSKTTVIPLLSINLTENQSQNFKLELLHHQIKSDPDQMKSVQENDAKQILFHTDLVTPKQGQLKYKTVGVNGVYTHGRYEKFGLTVCV